MAVPEFLEGFERIPATTAGSSYVGDFPFKLVLHTTEGHSIASAVAEYANPVKRAWPHFTVSFAERRKVQHYPLNIASRAVKNLDGGVETNRARAINLEIVGFAVKTPEMSAEELEWLAVEAVRPLMELLDIPAVAPAFVAHPASFGFGAAQRFDGPTWLAFHGVCGHQHVAENDHGDPGALNVQALIGGDMPLNDADKVFIRDQVLAIVRSEGITANASVAANGVQSIQNKIADLTASLSALSTDELSAVADAVNDELGRRQPPP